MFAAKREVGAPAGKWEAGLGAVAAPRRRHRGNVLVVGLTVGSFELAEDWEELLDLGGNNMVQLSPKRKGQKPAAVQLVGFRLWEALQAPNELKQHGSQTDGQSTLAGPLKSSNHYLTITRLWQPTQHSPIGIQTINEQ